MELVECYVQALQAVIAAGANVRMVVNGRGVGVLSVEVSDRGLKVGYLTASSPAELYTFVSLATTFMVIFDDWPEGFVQMGWYR